VTLATAGLHPVTGAPREVETLVGRWLAEDGPPALTVRTSGSTGEAKDVVLSAAALRASATATLSRLGGAGQWVLALPAQYVAGLQVIVRSVLAGTSPVHLADHPDLSSATRSLGPGRRYLAIVPTLLHRWLADEASVQALAEYDAVLLGGAAAAPSLLGAARDRGVAVVTTYGMSETCGGCVYDGVALDGVAVVVGRGGEIRLGGPTLFDGYAGRPDLTAAVLRDGWLHTPDLGRLDDDGRLEVLGRADDVVVSGGVNVALPAVENRLAAMPAVDQCAVVAVPDPEWGARVVAVLVPAAGSAPPNLDEARDFVSETMPRSWAPRTLALRDALPLLASGKVDRRALVRELAPA
jgi:O-succinylbenzoic acid--CoA ligase